jgi:hypothetical protein
MTIISRTTTTTTTTTTTHSTSSTPTPNAYEEELERKHSPEPKTILNRRDLARHTPPIPCYKVEKIPAKYGSAALYDEWLPGAVANGHATLVQSLEIPPREARSGKVAAGRFVADLLSPRPTSG